MCQKYVCVLEKSVSERHRLTVFHEDTRSINRYIYDCFKLRDDFT